MEGFEIAFWRKVHKLRPDDCWLWTGGFAGHNGLYYGYVSIGSKRRGAHRIAWELHNKKRIPEGLLIRHTCDNGLCCNPSHLLTGTVQDNADDRVARGCPVERRGRVKPVDTRFRLR